MFKSYDDYYRFLKVLWAQQGCVINPFRRSSDGIQFMLFYENKSGLLKVLNQGDDYQVDYSQLKDPDLADFLSASLSDALKEPDPNFGIPTSLQEEQAVPQNPETLMGVSLVASEDYFGPLCVAAVSLDHCPSGDPSLLSIDEIQAFPHAVLVLRNDSYNCVYEKMQNQDHLISWAQLRVITDTLVQKDQPYIAVDSLRHSRMIQTNLRAKGREVTVLDKAQIAAHPANEYAQILATYCYQEEVIQLESHYQCKLPKGKADRVQAQKDVFIATHGEEELRFVAKCHLGIDRQG